MLECIFKPKSIALIGASRNVSSLGYDVLKNVKELGYKGAIYPVNPKAENILDLECFKSVLDIPGKVDLAIIMVPAKLVNQVVEECGQKEIKGVVVISAGFKEIGEKGEKLELELQRITKKYKIQLIGPNCLGILNPHLSLNASFAEGMPGKGNIGLVSQSGAMAVAIIDWADQSKLGFSKIISIGNKAGLTEIELLKYLSSDPETEVIMMYLESLTDGREFMKLADKVTNKKPVIILKAGTSEIGSRAISSHTGSLAGSDQAVETAFKQSGIIRARTVEDFFDFAKGFSWSILPKGKKVAIVTNAGGPGIMATDALAASNLELAKLSEETKEYLKNNLPSSASVNNPVDIIGDALADRYKIALEAVLKDPGVDSVITILTPQTMTEGDKTAELITKLKTTKPILPVFMGGKNVRASRLIFQKEKVPTFEYPDRAVIVLDQMVQAKKFKINIDLLKYKGKNKKLNFEINNKLQLRTIDAEKLISEYDIPVLKNTLVKNKLELDKVIKGLMAMKIASRDVVHKKATGAVEINIKNRYQAEEAFDKIINNVKKFDEQAEIDGILVQPMAKPGVEVIIGMKRDSQFGPMIVFGLGGSLVEIVKDVSFRMAPITKKDALEQIKEIKGYPLIKDKDINLLADILIKISKLSLDYPEIKEIDLNPIIIREQGGDVVDVRILL